MSGGPSQRLFERARDWAADAEELAELQWQLMRLETRELFSDLRRGMILFVAAAGLAAIGFPLALVAGLGVLAQAMEWPLAPTLAISGVIFVALALVIGFAAGASWKQHRWLPRSRRQAVQNFRSVLSSWKTSSQDEEPYDDRYFHN